LYCERKLKSTAMVVIYTNADAYSCVCFHWVAVTASQSGNMLDAVAINFDSARTSSAYIIHYVNETPPPV
jgi:hypothetical protein